MHEHRQTADRDERQATRRVDAAPAPPLLDLQRSAGNRGVQQLMGSPGLKAVPAVAGLVQRVLEAAVVTRVRKQGVTASYNIQNRLSHIYQRHGSGSTATGAGKFADNKKIPGWVRAGIDNGTVDVNPGGYKFEHNLGEVIGTSINGAEASSIRVILTVPDNTGKRGKDKSEPFINTAFPF
jgi:hypothetical protein